MTRERSIVGNADYDALYRGQSGLEEVTLSFEGVPWDIGGPQPEIVELERAGKFRGSVLDAGCGPGDNAVYLAQRGYPVTGVDFSPTVLDSARQRAARQQVEVRFVLDNVTSLAEIDQPVDSVLDSTLYHCIGPDKRRDYSAALHRVTRPGGVLNLFCFADDGPGHMPAPHQVSQDDLRTNLGGHWDITSIELGRYASQLTRQDLEILSSQGTDFPEIDPAESELDGQGRVLVPVWRLHARRR